MEEKNLKMILHIVKGTLYLLIIEFVLGMVMNLYAVSPDDPKYLTESFLIKLSSGFHMLVGVLFPIFAIALLVFSFKSKKAEFKKWAIIGFASILIATTAGILTITLEEELSEIFSFVMALGFIMSFVSYGKFYLLINSSRK